MVHLHVDLRAIAFLEGEWCNQTRRQQEVFTPGNNSTDRASTRGQPSHCSCQAGGQSRAQATRARHIQQQASSPHHKVALPPVQRLQALTKNAAQPKQYIFPRVKDPNAVARRQYTSTPVTLDEAAAATQPALALSLLCFPPNTNSHGDSDKHSSNPTQARRAAQPTLLQCVCQPAKKPMLHATLGCRVCGVVTTPQKQ